MTKPKIAKRVSTALLNSLGAGVVPRIGLEYIAVGRTKEIAACLQDLDNIAEGGAAFRTIVGRYGAGKSFMLQLIRNHAMERGFVVADVDLSPERRLAGGNRQGVATYRELMRNLATKIRPDGGGLAPLLEGWINAIQNQVVQATGMRPNDEGFDDQVEAQIRAVVKDIEGLVHGFEFANIISAYWRGYRLDNDRLKDAALRWLRGEFATKTEAKTELGVRVIIDDDTWYDYIKLVAKFVADIGYKGLIVLIDEAVHLLKITHAVSRQSNYDKLLAIFNDTMQGKAENLYTIIGGTPQFVEDPRRGLYSDEAWRSRLVGSSRIQGKFQDTTAPLIRLDPLTKPEIEQLLQRLAEVHAVHYKYDYFLTAQDLQTFVDEVANRLGADTLLTAREVVRDLVAALNIRQQNPQTSWQDLVRSTAFQVTDGDRDPDGEFAEFTV
jgi:P-loop Domain of unknown function (DUF2791)